MTVQVTSFADMSLSAPLQKALNDVGYETPSPIQAETIPLLLEGRDVLGQAQTGTGKTAAFALPVLSRLDLNGSYTQALVLAPTRELAIQVAEAFQTYAKYLKGFHVLPVYGGSDYGTQIRSLKRGAHVVVGTPGRIMDHMRKGTLKLDKLQTLVLDEGDEMLRMGFIDDVEWIMEQMPAEHQTALFSATMPQQIKRIANKYLNDPAEITIKVKTTTADTIRQRYLPVKGVQKLDALTRILEAESFEGMIVFVRTKTTTAELSEKLAARGYSCAPLNGDISQQVREQTVKRLKSGKLDIIIATDVAARGLDVERISHVLNYDIPYDTESYVHRIGRTGRAGREGEAILFVAPRERRMLQAIERATRKPIEQMELPSTEQINDKRIAKFKEQINEALEQKDLAPFGELIDQYRQGNDVDERQLLAALASMAMGDEPFVKDMPQISGRDRDERRSSDSRSRPDFGRNEGRNEGRGRDKPRRERDGKERSGSERPRKESKLVPMEPGMMRYRLDVGYDHDVKPGNIVGAIANEAGLDSKHIGRISIFDDYSVIDLPEGMPKEIFKILKKTRVAGQKLDISKFTDKPASGKSKTKKSDADKAEDSSGKSAKGKSEKKSKAKSDDTDSKDDGQD